MSKYIILERDYEFVEHLEDDFYEFIGVKLDKDNTRYDMFDNGFVWLDSFGLSWNMSALNIVRKLDDTYDIVAVRD
jgi:hypothetical protein